MAFPYTTTNRYGPLTSVHRNKLDSSGLRTGEKSHGDAIHPVFCLDTEEISMITPNDKVHHRDAASVSF